MEDLIRLKLKWKPILETKNSFSKEEIEDFNKDVKNYKTKNPNWEQENSNLELIR